MPLDILPEPRVRATRSRKTAKVSIKGCRRLTPHPLRAAVLGEVHARPFTPLEAPRRVMHFAFDTMGEAARAATLLRTRVDVELERRNRDPLKSMDARTRIQLRLQTTVEGLSVAAVSYYVVGLFGYLAKGLHDRGVPIDTTLAGALFAPVAVLAVWLVVPRIRKTHIAGAD